MEARAKVLGHAVHQMLIPYPLALLTTAIIFDVVHLFTGNPLWSIVAYWMIAAGIIGGLLAAVFGLIDFRSIPKDTRARHVGFLHGTGNVVMILLSRRAGGSSRHGGGRRRKSQRAQLTQRAAGDPRAIGAHELTAVLGRPM